MNIALRHFQYSWITLAAATLASGCGGGGGGTTPVPPVQVTGKVVINQAIKGATVCLDLNSNQACDTTEPTSAATGSDGTYSFSYDSTAITTDQIAKSAIIARIPAASAADATTPAVAAISSDIVLSAPASAPSQINPLTTLLWTGISAGLTQAKAEADVAIQLNITAAKIYDYQSDASDSTQLLDNARSLALATAKLLSQGLALSVVDTAAAAADTTSLRQFTFNDANNYSSRIYSSTDITGTGLRQVLDQRSGLSAGTAIANNLLYQAAYLTPKGWLTCDASGFTVTRGTPYRANYCGSGLPQLSYSTDLTDVSGQKMSDVITKLQAATDGSNTLNLDPSLVGSATFPTGSTLQTYNNFDIGRAIWINNLNSTVEVLSQFTSLESFIAARATSNVVLNPAKGVTWLGYTGDLSHWLGASFTDAKSQVQYYSCTFNATTNSFTTCTPAGTGTFAIVTVNGSRLIQFQGQPAPVANVTYTVGYGEYNGIVARYRQAIPGQTTLTRRLNGTGWQALKTALGI